MFDQLEEVNSRPKPFEFYTAGDLWTDEYISKQMLANHLSQDTDLASRKLSFIERSVPWMIATFDLREGKYFRYDLIVMIFCDFCALSPAQRKTLLEKFKSLLKAGGSILLDVCSTRSFERKAESVSYEVSLSNGFWSPEKYYCFLNVFQYDDAKVTLSKFTIIEKNRTRQIFNWLQHYDRESIAKECTESGLKIEKYLGNVAGDDFNADWDEFAVIARAIA